MKIKKAPIMAMALCVCWASFCWAAPFLGKDFKPGAPVERQLPYHGNFKTMKYHNQSCKHYDCRTCTKIFKTKAAAEKAGYKACEKCGG